MRQPGQRARLAQRAFVRAFALTGRLLHDLQRDEAFELVVAREVDRAHAAVADFAEDRVALELHDTARRLPGLEAVEQPWQCLTELRIGQLSGRNRDRSARVEVVPEATAQFFRERSGRRFVLRHGPPRVDHIDIAVGRDPTCRAAARRRRRRRRGRTGSVARRGTAVGPDRRPRSCDRRGRGSGTRRRPRSAPCT